MDLNTLFAAGTAVIELKHPLTGETLFDESEPAKPMTLTVMGKHTDEYKVMEREIGFNAMKRTKNLKVEKMSFDEFLAATKKNDEETLKLLAGTITACNIFMDGKVLKHSHKNMLNLLSDERCSWVKDQLVEELNKTELFFKS